MCIRDRDKLEPLLEPKKDDRKWLLFLLPMLALVFFVLLVMVKFPENNTKSEVKSIAGKTDDVKTEQNLIISSDKLKIERELNIESEQENDVSNSKESPNLNKQSSFDYVQDLNSHPSATLRNQPSTSRILANTLRLRSCLLYTSPSPRDATLSRMPSSA